MDDSCSFAICETSFFDPLENFILQKARVNFFYYNAFETALLISFLVSVLWVKLSRADELQQLTCTAEHSSGRWHWVRWRWRGRRRSWRGPGRKTREGAAACCALGRAAQRVHGVLPRDYELAPRQGTLVALLANTHRAATVATKTVFICDYWLAAYRVYINWQVPRVSLFADAPRALLQRLLLWRPARLAAICSPAANCQRHLRRHQSAIPAGLFRCLRKSNFYCINLKLVQ